MLTDTKLHNLGPQDKPYKMNDRDGLYAAATPAGPRALTDAIVKRGAPATAVHAREVVLQVYRWAIECGQEVENPADMVRPTTIAKFEPRDRALTPDEIGLMYQYMERIGTTRPGMVA